MYVLTILAEPKLLTILAEPKPFLIQSCFANNQISLVKSCG
jgi:hypothetical protein